MLRLDWKKQGKSSMRRFRQGLGPARRPPKPSDRLFDLKKQSQRPNRKQNAGVLKPRKVKREEKGLENKKKPRTSDCSRFAKKQPKSLGSWNPPESRSVPLSEQRPWPRKTPPFRRQPCRRSANNRQSWHQTSRRFARLKHESKVDSMHWLNSAKVERVSPKA